MKKHKVLIVDDSALMRKLLREIFEKERDFIVEVARNGREAVEKNLTFQPDVITLDINMPEMDGLTALSIIMNERPVPVVMVSSLTEKGALTTLEALNLGAVDFVTKSGGTISLNIADIKEEILSKVRTALNSKVRVRYLVKQMQKKSKKTLAAQERPMVGDERVILIGTSTGGPKTLEEVLPELPADFPIPIVIAQHMPATFTKTLAERLNSICRLEVVEVAHPMPLESGRVYIGRGERDVVLSRRGGRLFVLSQPPDPSYLWHPSVEVLGRSALKHCDPTKVIGVLLTGMGYDGAQAFTEIKNRGGKTIAESEETAIVFGMPRELIERGGATVVLPVDKIAKTLIKWSKEQ